MAGAAGARADILLGSWEDSADRWIDWQTQASIDGNPKYSYSDIGVTAGSKSLKITQAGYGQNLAIKLQQDYSPANDLRDDFLAHTHFSIDVLFPGNTVEATPETPRFAEVYALSINAQNHGFQDELPKPKLQYFFPNADARRATVTWDYSRLVDGDPSTPDLSPTAGWLELILATNSSHPELGEFYFDNARLTAPFLRVDLNGGGASTGHPNQAGFNSWDDLPTSGQNGSGAQFGYPTASATKSFTSFSHASGAIQTTLTSVDVVNGPGGAAYATGATPEDGPKLNARDMSIPGRELDNSGNFTPKKDSVYRDFIFAEAGTATSSTGTNHRLEVKFEGLDPNTPYKVKFYAYDNSNPQGVSVFTDVTAQPLIAMPSGNSTDGAFTPGDGSGNTQYAPQGQFIDGTAPVTFPAGDDFRAIELFATSDGTGRIVFAETTITGLAGTAQILPVLNGFEIEKDQRAWLNAAASSNWNDAANWSGGAIPNMKGQVANFGSTAVTSINVDAPTTVARLNFSGSSLNVGGGGGGGTLTLDDNSINSTLSGGVITGRTEINLTGSSAHQTISAPLALKKDTQVWTATAAQKVTISDLQPAAVTLTKVGDGELEVNNVRTNALRVFGGTVTITPNGAAAGTSNVGALSIGENARLDLKNNKLVTNSSVGTWDGTKYTGIQGEVARAYDFGAWDLPGIMTSEPDAGPTVGKATIGVATGAQALFLGADETGVFGGQTISGTTAIAMYTWAGDVDLNGYVDAVDYGTIDQWIQFPGTTGYTNGDLNYDGVIDAVDYGIIDNGIQLQGPPIPVNGDVGVAASAGLAAVPEPASAMVLITGALAMLGRRHRRHRVR